MICPGCHADNPADASTCERCGHSLTPSLEVRAGTFLGGRYEVVQVLGKGGMGTVFLAHDRLLDERVALKVLRGGDDQSPDAVQRFIQEIKLARAVSHRNVCRIHEYGEDRGVRYISMAYVEGVELRALLHEGGALPALEAVEFAIGVAEGLHAIHEEGIVHRDLKPANVMVDRKGLVRVMDFGIAKASSAPGLTASGSLIGTPEYMSPEQIRGTRLDRRSDIYSLGVMLYELLTGSVPFRGDTAVDTILRHLQDAPDLDTLQLTHLPVKVKGIIARALAKEPDARYATAFQLARALEAVRHQLAAAPTVARGEATREIPAAERPAWRAGTPLPATRRPSRGRRRLLILAAAGLVAAIAAAVWRPGWPEGTSAHPAPSVPIQTMPPTAPSLAPTLEPKAPPLTPPPAMSRPRPATPGPSPPPRAVPRPSATPVEPSREAASTQRIPRLLASAEEALLAGNYEGAMKLYDEALALEPGNETARRGRATALDARVRTQFTPAPSAAPRGVLLVAGKTTATSPETRTESAFAEDFESAGKVEVTRATQDPVLPGRIEFGVEPERLLTGEPYTVRITLWNPGRAPIDVAEMSITTVANHRRTTGTLPPLTRQVGPGLRAPLAELKDRWPDNVQSWSLEATVVTSRHETYRNTLTLQGGQ